MWLISINVIKLILPILGFVGHGNPSLCRCGVQVDCGRQYLIVSHVAAVNNVWWLHGFVQYITVPARHSVWLCSVLVSRRSLDAWVATRHPCVYIVGLMPKAFDCVSHCLLLTVCLLNCFQSNEFSHLLRLVVLHLFVVKRHKQQLATHLCTCLHLPRYGKQIQKPSSPFSNKRCHLQGNIVASTVLTTVWEISHHSSQKHIITLSLSFHHQIFEIFNNQQRLGRYLTS